MAHAVLLRSAGRGGGAGAALFQREALLEPPRALEDEGDAAARPRAAEGRFEADAAARPLADDRVLPRGLAVRVHVADVAVADDEGGARVRLSHAPKGEEARRAEASAASGAEEAARAARVQTQTLREALERNAEEHAVTRAALAEAKVEIERLRAAATAAARREARGLDRGRAEVWDRWERGVGCAVARAVCARD